MSRRTLGLGIIGLGRAFMLMRPAFAASAKIHVVAAADPRAEARRQFSQEFRGTAYEDVESLLRDPHVDAVYIASPHQYHAAQAIAAAEAGKHIVVEKPMALTLADAQAMVDAARRAQVKLIVGHSHSFDAPIAATRGIIASGEFGRLKMITALNFTDFLYRPRRPEELNTEKGGGVVFNQAAHQIDIARLLAGGLAESVMAQTGVWDAARPTEGAYNVLLRFPGDVVASLIYNGYAHFDSDELVGWISEMGLPKDPNSFLATRKTLQAAATPEAERDLRTQRGYGVVASSIAPDHPIQHQHEHFGFIVASCERADLRPTPAGVLVYGDVERAMRALPPPASPRREVVDELCEAVFENKVPLHSGEWGLATLEVCLAILRSSRERGPVELHRQVAART